MPDVCVVFFDTNSGGVYSSVSSFLQEEGNLRFVVPPHHFSVPEDAAPPLSDREYWLHGTLLYQGHGRGGGHFRAAALDMQHRLDAGHSSWLCYDDYDERYKAAVRRVCNQVGLREFFSAYVVAAALYVKAALVDRAVLDAMRSNASAFYH
jgi:hypothetical protein